MTKKGGEIAVRIDDSLGEVYYQAEMLQKRLGYRDNSRLILLGGLIRHPSVSQTLEDASHDPWKFDFVISRMKNHRLATGGDLAYPRASINSDIMMQAYEEAKSRGKDRIYPVDVMVGLLRLQPPPVDRVLASLEIDRMAIIEELKKAASLPQEPETS